MVADRRRGPSGDGLRERAGRVVKGVLRAAGYQLVPTADRPGLPLDFGPDEVALCERVAPYTLTSPERIVALRDAVRYLVRAGVPGAMVECGVWRGGSMQVVALTLLEAGVDDRDLYLFDTFGDMPPPGDLDVNIWGRPARLDWERHAVGPDPATASIYDPLPLDQVRAVLAATGYPERGLHFVAGRVEETVPDRAPGQIALLRLDTDWYESTRHELVHLFERVAPGGVVLVDDYGHFQGARHAVEEYLAERDLAVYLHRVDYTARLIVVPGVPP